ncbi:uncharacterized protein LOC128552962, partial [Mercenaria mercenaria]|uniref:uncharacterized protein LOC128552962 n=1 Tax=Mercenaria mercenaria TaxID=6596 RepID=UPI00234F6629
KTGAYVESLRIIFWKDVLPFGVVFCIVNVAFGGTFLLVLKGEDSLETHNETSSLFGIWYVGIRTLIEAQPVVEYTGEEGYKLAGTFVMLLFMSMTTVVLLNILIAQISETYQNVQVDAWKSVVVNRALIITRLERNRSHFTFCKNLFNGKEVYEEDVEGNNLEKMVEKHLQPMKQIESKLIDIQNKLVKNDLNVETVKTRLNKLKEMLAGTQNTLKSLTKDLDTS